MALSEADTRAKLIDPAIHACGWTEDMVCRETTLGAVEIIAGKARRRSGGRSPQATPFVVVEPDAPATGLRSQHAILLAQKLDQIALFPLKPPEQPRASSTTKSRGESTRTAGRRNFRTVRPPAARLPPRRASLA